MSALEVGLLNPGQSQQPIPMFRGDPTRKIWQGELSWVNPNQSQTIQEQVAHSVFCIVSTQYMESSQPTVCSDNWPKRLILQTIPDSLIQQIGGTSSKYFQNARSVLFDFTDTPAKFFLTKVLNDGYAGCVHFRSSEDNTPRVLILLFSPADNNYLGYIPNEQVQFIDCLRKAAASGPRVPAGSQGQPQESGGTMLSNLQSNHQQQQQ